jgi:DNA-binding FrmR family transcriptional regulator
MLASGETCEAVVTQIFAARAALDGVASEVLKCQVEEALGAENPQEARESVMRMISLLRRV